MQNFIFKYEGHTYVTLFGINYLNKKVEDTAILPDGVLTAVRKTYHPSAELTDINISKDFNGNCVATANVKIHDKYYYLDTSNDSNPLRELSSAPTVEPKPEPVVERKPEPAPEPVVERKPEPAPEPVVEKVPESAPEPKPEPVVVRKPEPAPEPKQDPKPVPEPVVEKVPEPAPESVVEKVPESAPEPKPEPKPVYNPIYLKRIDAYSLTPISMEEVKLKGDAYCEMTGWEKVDNIYLIDDVVAVKRYIHSDALGLNLAIPYEEVANYGKD